MNEVSSGGGEGDKWKRKSWRSWFRSWERIAWTRRLKKGERMSGGGFVANIAHTTNKRG